MQLRCLKWLSVFSDMVQHIFCFFEKVKKKHASYLQPNSLFIQVKHFFCSFSVFQHFLIRHNACYFAQFEHIYNVTFTVLGSGCVAQLVEWSLPIPEVCGSNPVIAWLFFQYLVICKFKIFHQHKIYKSKRKILQNTITPKPSKVTKYLKIYQSGEISPNMVTLVSDIFCCYLHMSIFKMCFFFSSLFFPFEFVQKIKKAVEAKSRRSSRHKIPPFLSPLTFHWQVALHTYPHGAFSPQLVYF